MHELLYYSIFAIVLYFVLTQVFENFNIEQENFDPSLVPVSSIVTLAKVAQKLVNGNGTLTNPGNLQIGASASAPGNLTVTGSAILNGGTTIKSGNQYGSVLSLLAGSSEPAYVNFMDPNNSSRYGYIMGKSSGFEISATSTTSTSNFNHNLTIAGNATVNGSSIFGGKTNNGFMWTNENGNGWACLRSGDGTPAAEGNRLCFNKGHGLAHFHPGGHLDIQGKITVPRVETGTINATGSATIGSLGKNANANVLTVNGNLDVNGYGLNVSNSIALNGVQLFSDGAQGLRVANSDGGNSKITVGSLNSTGGATITGGSTITGTTWMNTVNANFFSATNGVTADTVNTNSLTVGGVTITGNQLQHLKDLLNGKLYFQLQAGQTGLLNTKGEAGGSQSGSTDPATYFHMARLDGNYNRFHEFSGGQYRHLIIGSSNIN